MRDNAKAYLDYEKKTRTPIHDTETEKLLDLLNPNNYEKGGWVLHSLRGMLGDTVFFNGLRQFYVTKKSGLATSEDLRLAFEKASGRDLKEFFDRWVYKSGHPIYKVSWSQAGANTIEVKLEQTQADDAFLMPVTLEIVTAKGSNEVKITPTGKQSSLRIKSAKPSRIVVDPDEFILKEVVE
jgi:aminopeptidase N